MVQIKNSTISSMLVLLLVLTNGAQYVLNETGETSNINNRLKEK